jgi:hypothetical protein
MERVLGKPSTLSYFCAPGFERRRPKSSLLSECRHASHSRGSQRSISGTIRKRCALLRPKRQKLPARGQSTSDPHQNGHLGSSLGSGQMMPLWATGPLHRSTTSQRSLRVTPHRIAAWDAGQTGSHREDQGTGGDDQSQNSPRNEQRAIWLELFRKR